MTTNNQQSRRHVDTHKQTRSLTPQQEHQVEQVNDSLARLWLHRKIGINYHVKAFKSLNSRYIDPDYVKHYKASFLAQWEQPLTEQMIVDQYDAKEVQPLIDYLHNNPHAMYQDVDPFITCYDAARLCWKYGLDLDAYKFWCQQYDEQYQWLPSVHLAMCAIFSPEYAKQLKAKTDVWKQLGRF